MGTNIKELKLAILCSDYDIIVLIESWLGGKISDDEITVKGYKVYWCDRSALASNKKRGGGVLIFIRSTLYSRAIKIDNTSIEQLYVFVKTVYCNNNTTSVDYKLNNTI